MNEEALAHWGAVAPKTNKYLLQGTSASNWRLVGHVVVSCYRALNHRRVNVRPSARERGAGALDGVAKFSLYKDLNIVDDVQIRRLGWAGHIVRMEDERIPEWFLVGNSTIKVQWEDQE